MNRLLPWRALVLSGAIVLGGCYESNVKVLNYGDQANISGSYTCSSERGLFPDRSITVTESVTGSGEKVDYRYQVQGGGMFRFTEMNTGMLLGQTLRGRQGWGRREHDARYGYLFVDVRGASGFTIYEANFGGSKKDIDQSAQTRNVRWKKNPYGRGPTATLTGTADEIFEFFNDHARYTLTETGRCSSSD